MSRIRDYNESGELVEGVFYSLDTLWDIPYVPPTKRLPGSVISTPRAATPVYGEVLYDEEIVERCRANLKHPVRTIKRNYRVDVFSGDCIAPFVPDSFMLVAVVNDALAKTLESSSLTGFGLETLPIAINQSPFPDPVLWRLLFLGTPCYRDFTVTVPDPNVCPFCGWGPVVCPTCRNVEYHCPECGNYIVVPEADLHRYSSKCFTHSGMLRGGWIIEGSRWDGSDFLAGVDGADMGFLSGRAVDWLLSVDAWPFGAEPCRTDVSRCTERQRQQLEAVRSRHASGELQ